VPAAVRHVKARVVPQGLRGPVEDLVQRPGAAAAPVEGAVDHGAARQVPGDVRAGGAHLVQGGLEIAQLPLRLLGEAAFDALHLETERQRAAQQKRDQGREQHDGEYPVAEGTANPFPHIPPPSSPHSARHWASRVSRYSPAQTAS